MFHERRERRGGRDFARRFPPRPVEMGKEYEVEIEQISRRGEGIARIKGFVCFVPKTSVGDHVRIRIIRVRRRFAEAEVVSEAAEEAEAVEEAAEEAEAVEEAAEEAEAVEEAA
ncbi:MAG: TRAM domain-containing protein, partial [Candidatus Bathyarchaeota archaeon]